MWQIRNEMSLLSHLFLLGTIELKWSSQVYCFSLLNNTVYQSMVRYAKISTSNSTVELLFVFIPRNCRGTSVTFKLIHIYHLSIMKHGKPLSNKLYFWWAGPLDFLLTGLSLTIPLSEELLNTDQSFFEKRLRICLWSTLAPRTALESCLSLGWLIHLAWNDFRSKDGFRKS